MQDLIIQLIMLLSMALLISVVAQALSEGLIKTFELKDKLGIKAMVFAIELWLVYYIAYFSLQVEVWQTLLFIALLVAAGAEAINVLIKKLPTVNNKSE